VFCKVWCVVVFSCTVWCVFVFSCIVWCLRTLWWRFQHQTDVCGRTS